MKKLLQLLTFVAVLAFVSSAWGAGAIKTFQLKVYNASIAYTSWDQAASGVTLAPSGVSSMTHTGGPAKQNAIPNTTDRTVIDLNDYLSEGGSLKEVSFLTTGVTLARSKKTTTNLGAAWKMGVQFSPVNSAAYWDTARTYYAGPSTSLLKTGDSSNGGVTGWTTQSAASKYAYSVMPILQEPIGGGVSSFFVEPIPVQRYMRPIIQTVGSPTIRNPEAWMSLVME